MGVPRGPGARPDGEATPRLPEFSAAHLFIHLAPWSAEEAAQLGMTDRGAAGAVPWRVTLAALTSVRRRRFPCSARSPR
ncbi:hypothetical protein [Streptomyces sp. NPDC087300]|uniref:hypothetical protein n=1 Tax=Streptomyces sp. NPDC087300 TaxID=3365780 RepID=UPI00381C6E9C